MTPSWVLTEDELRWCRQEIERAAEVISSIKPQFPVTEACVKELSVLATYHTKAALWPCDILPEVLVELKTGTELPHTWEYFARMGVLREFERSKRPRLKFRSLALPSTAELDRLRREEARKFDPPQVPAVKLWENYLKLVDLYSKDFIGSPTNRAGVWGSDPSSMLDFYRGEFDDWPGRDPRHWTQSIARKHLANLGLNVDEFRFGYGVIESAYVVLDEIRITLLSNDAAGCCSFCLRLFQPAERSDAQAFHYCSSDCREQENKLLWEWKMRQETRVRKSHQKAQYSVS